MDQTILEVLGHDRVAEYFGIRVESCSEGRAVAVMDIDQRHLNGIDIAQGGAIFTLADTAFALAANTRGSAVAASTTINFCSAVRSGTIRAIAEELSLSRKLGTYQVRIEQEDGTLAAVFQGMVYRKSE